MRDDGEGAKDDPQNCSYIAQDLCQDKWECRWEEEEPRLIASLCFNQQRLWALIPSWSRYEEAQIEQ